MQLAPPPGSKEAPEGWQSPATATSPASPTSASLTALLGKPRAQTQAPSAPESRAAKVAPAVAAPQPKSPAPVPATTRSPPRGETATGAMGAVAVVPSTRSAQTGAPPASSLPSMSEPAAGGVNSAWVPSAVGSTATPAKRSSPPGRAAVRSAACEKVGKVATGPARAPLAPVSRAANAAVVTVHGS